MPVHHCARADLEVTLVQIVRSGEKIDFLEYDSDTATIFTEDRIETRPTHAERLGVKR